MALLVLFEGRVPAVVAAAAFQVQTNRTPTDTHWQTIELRKKSLQRVWGGTGIDCGAVIAGVGAAPACSPARASPRKAGRRLPRRAPDLPAGEVLQYAHSRGVPADGARRHRLLISP